MKTVMFVFKDNFTTAFMQRVNIFTADKIMMKAPVKSQVPDNWGMPDFQDACDKGVAGDPYTLVAAVTSSEIFCTTGTEQASDGRRSYSLLAWLQSLRDYGFTSG
jgi:hypothetical protein